MSREGRNSRHWQSSRVCTYFLCCWFSYRKKSDNSCRICYRKHRWIQEQAWRCYFSGERKIRDIAAATCERSSLLAIINVLRTKFEDKVVANMTSETILFCFLSLWWYHITSTWLQLFVFGWLSLASIPVESLGQSLSGWWGTFWRNGQQGGCHGESNYRQTTEHLRA